VTGSVAELMPTTFVRGMLSDFRAWPVGGVDRWVKFAPAS